MSVLQRWLLAGVVLWGICALGANGPRWADALQILLAMLFAFAFGTTLGKR